MSLHNRSYEFHASLLALMAANFSLWDWAGWAQQHFESGSQNHLPQAPLHISGVYIWFSMVQRIISSFHMWEPICSSLFIWVAPLGCWFIPLSSGCCYVFIDWLLVICFLCIVSDWVLLSSLYNFYESAKQTIEIRIKPYIISTKCIFF